MSTEEANTAQPDSKVPEPSSPSIKLTINTKEKASTEKQECTCKHVPAKPLDLDDSGNQSDDSIISVRPSRSRRRGPIHRYRSPSTPRGTIRLTSSSQLLAQVNTFDGLAEFPYPGRQSVYLTTFPFTEHDVRKWSWLFNASQRETWMYEMKGLGSGSGIVEEDDFDGPAPYYYGGRRQRSRSPYYNNNDVPNVYLSRALDENVVKEQDGKKFRYLIIVQNGNKQPASKLLVAHSRQAAGIMVFYEALNGNAVAFVGAVVEKAGVKRDRRVPVKFSKVDNVEEAEAAEEGEVEIIC